jgi:hypothetical protein
LTFIESIVGYKLQLQCRIFGSLVLRKDEERREDKRSEEEEKTRETREEKRKRIIRTRKCLNTKTSHVTKLPTMYFVSSNSRCTFHCR